MKILTADDEAFPLGSIRHAVRQAQPDAELAAAALAILRFSPRVRRWILHTRKPRCGLPIWLTAAGLRATRENCAPLLWEDKPNTGEMRTDLRRLSPDLAHSLAVIGTGRTHKMQAGAEAYMARRPADLFPETAAAGCQGPTRRCNFCPHLL
jgi:hypothetical protein